MDSYLTFDKREPSNDEIVPEVSDQAGHQQGRHAGREEQMVKFGYGLEHEAADGKRRRADAGEAADATKRKKGNTGKEDHSSDKKVKSQVHGEWAYMEAV